MECIYCGKQTKVGNSRHQKRKNNIWRRRTCLSCGTTFTTIEAADLGGSITVKDRDQLKAFQRDKLFISIFDSLKHRKTAQIDATALTETIISQLYPYMSHVTIEKHTIKKIAIVTLERFDKVAATHYSAFHPIPKEGNS